MTTKRSEHEIITEAIRNPETVSMPTLVAELMSANFAGYTNAVNAEVEHLRGMVADRDAELGAIRRRINQLFAGDFMPTQEAIQMAVFYPAKALVDEIRNAAEPAS